MPRVSEVAGVLSVMVAFAGCYPLMAHPTRVENGGMLTMVAGGQVARTKPDSGASHVTFIPNVALLLVVGARDSVRRNSVSTRLSFGAGLSGLAWGAYAELPESVLGETDAGFGVSGQYGSTFTTLMPYFQFGRRMNSRAAWLVSQGMAMVNTGDSLGWSPLLSTTLGLSGHGEWSSGVFFITLLTGNRSYEYSCGICVSKGTLGRSFVLFGVSNGFRRGSSRIPPIPRGR